MGSNLAASTRAILSKRSMGMDMGKNMSPANLYAVLTIMASAMLLPLSAIVEGPKIQSLWASTVDSAEKRWVKKLSTRGTLWGKIRAAHRPCCCKRSSTVRRCAVDPRLAGF